MSDKIRGPGRPSLFPKSSPKDVTLPAADMVNAPPHYRRGGIEVIDVIDALGFDFYDANAFKYLARAGHKNPDKEIEDREKSIWYQQRKLNKLKAARVPITDLAGAMAKAFGNGSDYPDGKL